VNELTMGLLGALLATNQPLAVSNVIQQQTGITVEVAADSTERELRDVMVADDAAHDEVNDWMRTNAIPKTDVMAQAELNRRILARFDLVRQGYEKFLRNHPDHAHGYLAFGSFLNDLGDEDGAKAQYENSKQLDPKNPAVWNQLANYFGEHGGLTNAFADYTEAIRLNPTEPVYYQNFATTVYLYRTDAKEFYHLTESQVFDKALGLYQQAMRLAPDNFVLATDYAESYYGIRPLRTNDALVAWTNALQVARTDAERQGVEIHLARVKIAAGFFAEASNHLAVVTNAAYLDLKKRLVRNLAESENPATNSVTESSPKIPAVAVTNAVGSITNPPAPVTAVTNGPPVPPPSSVWQTTPPVLRGQKPQ
jgi:cytochrome c-type biogenesis protein CcmH/NrfG